MSLFNWLLPEKWRQRPSDSLRNSGASHPRSNAGAEDNPSKGQRNQRREKLYAVIREAMLHAGVLPTSYKFKVLSLDSRGRRFMVMMDLAHEYGDEPARQGQVERRIIEVARARDKISVTSVYWRLSSTVSAMQPPGRVGSWRASMPSQEPRPLSFIQSQPAPAADPIEHDEVQAFKQAFAKAAAQPVAPLPKAAAAPVADAFAATVAIAATPAAARSAHSYTLLTGYEETEMPEEDNPALSGTQYGALN